MEGDMDNIIEGITREPSWNRKKAAEERAAREAADRAFRAQGAAVNRLIRLVNFWRGIAAVLALVLAFILIAWLT
jgi:hypothetical protein